MDKKRNTGLDAPNPFVEEGSLVGMVRGSGSPIYIISKLTFQMSQDIASFKANVLPQRLFLFSKVIFKVLEKDPLKQG